MKKKKVLIIPNSGLTKIKEDFYVDERTGKFALELQNLGNKVIFFGQAVKVDTIIHTFKLKENGIEVISLDRKKNKLLNYICLYIKSLKPIFSADYIYIFYPNALKFTGLEAILLRKRYGLYIRGMNHLKGKFSRILYKNSDAVFTVSNFFTAYVNKVVGKNIAETIRPMIALTNKDIIRDRVYNAKHQYKLLYLGRITKEKGLYELLEAINELKSDGINLQLKIVGDGDEINSLKKTCRQLNLLDTVSFEGPCYDQRLIVKYYLNADIYILPTYSEGFPRTLYEAMVYGTPIVTTFVGGIPSIMKNEFNCLEIIPQSAKSIVDVVKRLITNYSQVIGYTKNATTTIERILDTNKLTHAQALNKRIN
ncbi:hypothetical protein A8C56_08010 [Niabella ginsenosidivorans]|uniref:Glycosyl transferase family 1 domain-containing protein n=1 Tax=Niabella ginsenosidivorans TaxID=1176587 RepID=A0A1A9I2Y8_9BACT|nr:glycosyltransferase family 4 protein [Niabella ginsenosidivorans]ANH80934.1 hypothetical protein A8C56_08010 [Niabella ginsenosidivorans]